MSYFTAQTGIDFLKCFVTDRRQKYMCNTLHLIIKPLFIRAEYPENALPDLGELGPALLVHGVVHVVVRAVLVPLAVVGAAGEGDAQAAALVIAGRGLQRWLLY